MIKHGDSGTNWLWKFLETLFNYQRGKVTIAITLMALISLTEGVGLLLLVPLLQLVGLDVEGGSLGQIEGLIKVFFSYLGIEPSLATILIIYIFIISFNAYLLRLQTLRSSAIQYQFSSYLRKKLFKHITYSDWLFFVKNKTSDLAHALTYEVERITLGTNQFLSLLASSIVLVVYILFALKLSGFTTGVIFLVGLTLLLILKKKTQSSSKSGFQISESSKDMYSATVKQMEGMKTIKSFQMEEENVSIFSKIADNVSNRYMDAIKSYSDVKFLFDVGSVVILSIIVYMMVALIQISTAELLILLFLFVRMIPRFSVIQRNYQYFINMIPAFKNIMELEERCKDAAEETFTGEDIDFDEEIRISGVEFTYPHEKDITIKNIDLTIKAGSVTALAGPSGAGKSTVADLIMNLIKPGKGEILVDGKKLDGKVTAWRSQIGYVAQDTYLFNDSIAHNLIFANPKSNQDDLWKALRLASADEFVSQLQDGLDTILGDRGVRLSGGERQRLALARALLRKPSLLILDEATSNLDQENENQILKALESLPHDITILIIAHRQSTIKNADIIYLMDQGRIIESGSYEELLKNRKGRFKELFQTL
ncbi:MAG: ABC transporter ATP-binding protein [Methanobacteriaceae archaeon]|nr:ABC transporter ATP-binding protein [Methanobacteriaceae archaeon]